MKIFLFSMVAIISYIFGMSFTQVFPEELENIYTNEKCGVSIQYPKDWKAEDVDYIIEGMRPIADISPDSDNQVSLNLLDISDYREKTIEYVSEVMRGSVEMGEELGEEVTIMQDKVIEIGGFPTHKLVYIIGTPEEYEFKEEKAWSMELNILAYDRIYEINLQTENQENFDEYSPIVDQIANTLKISKPNFEGINCGLKSPSKNSDQNLSTKKDNIVNIASRDSNIQETSIPINVIDDIMRKHQQFAYTLGNPSSNIQITDDSQGYYQKFSKGVIYWHPQFGVHEVHGGISDKWENLGNEKGTLGYPISDEYDNTGGRQSDFEKGHISWSEENGEITVFMGKE